ncbi:SDR family NAD(P)-dependent oxidoreductase [Aestuariispira insulae]|uniref:SDR family NAD(P)-dependent oxidoreductase n=1 Tax=Aestuariispira insulae TaxID=1461337 RepID=UPI000E2263F8|nr:SDR family NAD(P)-dependent oxidoreductase [Aestuariispira insulae]
MKPPKSILITGASSGIGRALAQAYAAPGVILFLSGRNLERLQETVADCLDRGADVHPKSLDVTDRAAMEAWIRESDSLSPLDLVIANAGISGGVAGKDKSGETEAQARQIFDINFNGVLNSIYPAIELYKLRQRGQIAIVSSLAGYRGLPGAPAYSASKAAVKAYGEALRGALKRDGIAVNVICPGFVVSRITDANRFPMPFLMKADRAAILIKKGLSVNRAVIAFPWPTRFVSWIFRILPGRLAVPLLSGLPAKE